MIWSAYNGYNNIETSSYSPNSGENSPERSEGRYDEIMIPFFGPIIPAAYNVCPASWGLLITVINNIISLLITLGLVLVAPIMIAYSGYLYVVSPVDPAGKSKARGILLHTIIGIIVMFAGWLIVDAVMAVIYNPSAVGGTWSSLITSGGIDPCLKQAASLINLNQTNLSVSGISANGSAVYISGKSGALCGNTACSPASLQAAGLAPAQANAMSCIAMTESTGNTNTPSSSTGACGTFQITRGNWNTASFHQSPCSTATPCNDPTCNLQTAQIMFSKSGYQPWTGICKNVNGCGVVAYGQPWNAGARACVNQYDPGNLKD
ncbi:MAG: hypothetical protein NTU85_02490 [Candidatus Kaiserbacteria bacterium]|nr:hypothetical protein [Candidatus Kaiserbacteria bacterium]